MEKFTRNQELFKKSNGHPRTEKLNIYINNTMGGLEK